jgi:hypothetical protein
MTGNMRLLVDIFSLNSSFRLFISNTLQTLIDSGLPERNEAALTRCMVVRLLNLIVPLFSMLNSMLSPGVAGTHAPLEMGFHSIASRRGF